MHSANTFDKTFARASRSAFSTDSDRRIAKKLLNKLTSEERTALHRFYVLGDDESTICSESTLTLIGFRALRAQMSAQFFQQRIDWTRTRNPDSMFEVRSVARQIPCAAAS